MASQAQLQPVLVPPPWRGMDLVSSPMQTKKEMGQRVLNSVPGRPGKVYLRGPIVHSYDCSTPLAAALGSTKGGALSEPGLWVHGNAILMSSWNARIQVWDGLALNTPFTLAGFEIPSRRYAQLGNYTFGAVTAFPGNQKALWRWDGSTTSAGLLQITNGTQQFADLAAFANRLVFLGGVPHDLVSIPEFTTLYWTDPNWDGSNTLASFQDDVTGLDNKIVFDSSTGRTMGQRYHTLIPWNQSLYILGTTGIVEMRGSGPSNWTIRPVSNVGCRFAASSNAARPAVALDDGIYFHGYTGIIRFDGVNTEIISEPVRPLFTNLAKTAELLQIDNDNLLCLIGKEQLLAYNRLTKTWSDLSSKILTGVPTAGPINLIDNPSAETTASFHTGGSINNTRTTDTSQFITGLQSFKLTATAGGNMTLQSSVGAGLGWFTATAGLPYSTSAYFRTAVTPRTCRVYLNFYDSGNSLLSSTGGTTIVDTTAGWLLAKVENVVAPANTAYAEQVCEIQGAAAAEIHYIDGRIAVQGTTVPSYFDGDSPSGVWLGLASAAGASQSQLATASSGAPSWLVRTDTSSTIWAFDTHIMADCSWLLQPDNIQFDVSNGTTNNGLDKGPTVPLDQSIASTVRTRLLELGALRNKIQLNRVYTDVIITQKSASGSPATVTVNLRDEADNVLSTAVINGNTTPGRKRATLTNFNEVDAFYIEWVVDAASQPLIDLEIHEAVVEYSMTRSRAD